MQNRRHSHKIHNTQANFHEDLKKKQTAVEMWRTELKIGKIRNGEKLKLTDLPISNHHEPISNVVQWAQYLKPHSYTTWSVIISPTLNCFVKTGKNTSSVLNIKYCSYFNIQ